MKYLKEEDIKILANKLEEYIKADNTKALTEALKDLHPADIAAVLNMMDEEDAIYIFEQLDTDIAADVLLELKDNLLAYILNRLSSTDISSLTSEMDTDDAADIIQELAPEKQKKVLDEIPDDEKKDVTDLLFYGEETAGGIMQREVLSVPLCSKISDVLNYLKTTDIEYEGIDSIFVTDKNGKLLGSVSIYDILRKPYDTPIESIIDKSIIAVNVNDDQEKVADIVSKYDLYSIPVVDDEGILKGIITVDDILDVIEEEATEDILRMSGVNADESVFSTPFESVRRRLPWLLVNLITAFIASSVVGLFQDTLDKVVILAVFMPIVAGMGGNAGTQAMAVIVRGLAVGDINRNDALRVIMKELTVGLISGLVVGIVTAIIAIFWKGITIIGLIIFLSLMINMTVACTMGVLIPLTLNFFKIDPALASTVFLTTVTDVTGFFTFLGLATLFFL